MFLSKIWFILIAVVSAVAGTFALVAPRPAVQKLAALEGQRLDRAQYAAEQMFKVDAHKWIDRVSKLGATPSCRSRSTPPPAGRANTPSFTARFRIASGPSSPISPPAAST